MANLDFDKTFSFILAREGGYVNHPNDSAGATNKGVTQAVYDQYRKSLNMPEQSVLHIEPSEVKNIFTDSYWKPMVNLGVSGAYLFCLTDLCYNSGVSRARNFHKIANGDVKKLIQLRREFYNKIVKNNPSQKVFLKGWMNRIDEVEKYVAAWDLITF